MGRRGPAVPGDPALPGGKAGCARVGEWKCRRVLPHRVLSCYSAMRTELALEKLINGNQMPQGGRRIGAGRPAGSGNKAPPELKEIARAYSEKAFSRVLQLIDSKDERVALMASNTVLDRAWGKAEGRGPAETLDNSNSNAVVNNIQSLYLTAIQQANRMPDPRVVDALAEPVTQKPQGANESNDW
jgi:hypothetical protein